MEVQAFINDTDRFSAYGHIDGNNMALYGEYRPSGWKFYYELDSTKVNYYKFMDIFDLMLGRFIDKYKPETIKVHSKFKIKPIILSNTKGYKYFLDGKKVIMEKINET